MIGVGNESAVNSTPANLRGLEEDKKFSFSIVKTHLMPMQLGRKKKLEDLQVKIKRGLITLTNEEKYLGYLINNKGSNSSRIKRKDKTIAITKMINRWAGLKIRAGHWSLTGQN